MATRWASEEIAAEAVDKAVKQWIAQPGNADVLATWTSKQAQRVGKKIPFIPSRDLKSIRWEVRGMQGPLGKKWVKKGDEVEVRDVESNWVVIQLKYVGKPQYFEDDSIEDVGLTWVFSKRVVMDSLSAEDAAVFLPGDAPGAMWLRLAEDAVDTFDRTKARQLGQDIDRLTGSPLPEETLRTVWLGAVLRSFDPAESGLDTRAWLNRMRETWLARVHRDDPDFMPAPPQPVVDEESRRAVLRAIARVAGDLDRAVTSRRSCGNPVHGLVPALEAVVTQACADLGYRLFLRVVKEYFVRIEKPVRDEFAALGERLGHPPCLVGDNLNCQE